MNSFRRESSSQLQSQDYWKSILEKRLHPEGPGIYFPSPERSQEATPIIYPEKLSVKMV